MPDIKVLVVDDEREIADLVEIYLQNEGYQVLKLYGGQDVMETLSRGNISLVILDVMMPGIDGINICRMIREKYNIPIIMLSAKSMDIDKVLGLSMGADDYIAKPFNPIELMARVKAQLRRFIKLNPGAREDGRPVGGVIEINGLVIDKDSFTVTLYDQKIVLTPIEFEILHLMAENCNKVLSSEEIFETVWKEKYYEASNNTVMVHIRHLREKLGESSRDPKFIRTVWGVGYKIEA